MLTECALQAAREGIRPDDEMDSRNDGMRVGVKLIPGEGLEFYSSGGHTGDVIHIHRA